MKSGWGRFLIFIGMLVVIMVMPWWLSLMCLFALTVYYPLYIEVLFFAFLIDLLYSANFSFPYPVLSIAFVYEIINLLIRERIRV